MTGSEMVHVKVEEVLYTNADSLCVRLFHPFAGRTLAVFLTPYVPHMALLHTGTVDQVVEVPRDLIDRKRLRSYVWHIRHKACDP